MSVRPGVSTSGAALQASRNVPSELEAYKLGLTSSKALLKRSALQTQCSTSGANQRSALLK